MFLLDSLMISGIRWALETTLTAAEAEMNDDTALRERLLEMEMRREMGEISDQEFAETEADLLGRIREIKERREGGSGAIGFSAGEAIETSEGSRFQVEASVSGDFHEAARVEPSGPVEPSEPLEPARSGGSRGSGGSEGSKGAARKSRTPRTKRTIRTPRTTRTTRTTLPARPKVP
jgi:hypothetical protein